MMEEGTLNWAFEIAKEKGEVWHRLNPHCCVEKYCLNEQKDDLVRESWTGKIISIKDVATTRGMLKGWFIKKSELMPKIIPKKEDTNHYWINCSNCDGQADATKLVEIEKKKTRKETLGKVNHILRSSKNLAEVIDKVQQENEIQEKD